MIKKAEVTRSRLLFVVEAIRALRADEVRRHPARHRQRTEKDDELGRFQMRQVRSAAHIDCMGMAACCNLRLSIGAEL